MKQKKLFQNLRTKVKYLFHRPVRKKLWSVFQKDTNPHSLSLGVALGLFWGFMPIMGIQMPVALITSRLIRANAFLAVGMVWITNPITAGPIYLFNYWVGSLFFDQANVLHLSTLKGLFSHFDWKTFASQGKAFYYPLIWGCLVVGVLGGAAGYFLTRYLLTFIIPAWERQKELHRLNRSSKESKEKPEE